MKLSIKYFLLGLTPLLFGAFCLAAPAAIGKPLVATLHSPAKWAGKANCKSKFGAYKDAKGVDWNPAFRNLTAVNAGAAPPAPRTGRRFR